MYEGQRKPATHCVCVWWQLFPTSEIAATDKKMCVGGGKQPNFYGEFVLTFFLNLPGIWDYRERQLKVELLHLDEIKKKEDVPSMPRAYKAVQRNISPKLITTSLLFFYVTLIIIMYMAILGRQSFKVLRTVQDFHFRSRGIIVGRMRKTSCIK